MISSRETAVRRSALVPFWPVGRAKTRVLGSESRWYRFGTVFSILLVLLKYIEKVIETASKRYQNSTTHTHTSQSTQAHNGASLTREVDRAPGGGAAGPVRRRPATQRVGTVPPSPLVGPSWRSEIAVPGWRLPDSRQSFFSALLTTASTSHRGSSRRGRFVVPPEPARASPGGLFR